MKILIASGRPHLPQATGGVPSSTHELAMELMGLGHEVSVLCGLSTAGFTGFRVRALLKFSKQRFIRDDVMGYPVYRQWDVQANIGAAVAALRPDVTIIQLGQLVLLNEAFRNQGVPTVVYIHNVEFDGFGGDPRRMKESQFVANSAFTARRCKELFDIDSTVIPPLFRAEQYITPQNPTNVTFINPIAVKGSALAFEIARRCPEIPFCFIKTWALDEQEAENLKREMATVGNVTLRPQTQNMKSVYRDAKILLAPSQWEETWGRVVSEAHFNGIPVVASNRGGLPEAVGPGGILLDADAAAELWVEAIKRLWSDAAYYDSKRQAALSYARRPELDPSKQADALLGVIRNAIAQQGAATYR